LAIAIGENFETQVWLDFALDAGYITATQHQELTTLSEEVGKLLSYMQANQPRFAKWKC
jgi:four helix bundle protein